MDKLIEIIGNPAVINLIALVLTGVVIPVGLVIAKHVIGAAKYGEYMKKLWAYRDAAMLIVREIEQVKKEIGFSATDKGLGKAIENLIKEFPELDASAAATFIRAAVNILNSQGGIWKANELNGLTSMSGCGVKSTTPTTIPKVQ